MGIVGKIDVVAAVDVEEVKGVEGGMLEVEVILIVEESFENCC